jgi:predicted alpha/beta hydrolase family esterase
MKTYVVHGWGGNSKEGWFPWLKKELEAKGIEAVVFDMPDTGNPKIEAWVKYLEDNIQNPDEEIILIGHSIGCQTILRYLEKLPENVKIGKIILVAPWFNLANLEGEEEISIAKQWLETPIDEKKVLEHISQKIVCIFSDNDFYDCLEENKKIFSEKYGAEIIIEHNKGHFSGDEGIIELSAVLDNIV